MTYLCEFIVFGGVQFDEETKSTCMPKCQAVIKWQKNKKTKQKQKTDVPTLYNH